LEFRFFSAVNSCEVNSVFSVNHVRTTGDLLLQEIIKPLSDVMRVWHRICLQLLITATRRQLINCSIRTV